MHLKTGLQLSLTLEKIHKIGNLLLTVHCGKERKPEFILLKYQSFCLYKKIECNLRDFHETTYIYQF